MIQAIYIHIPFCLKKCFYCDFPSFTYKEEELIEQYVQSLICEINSTKINLEEGATLYFGGGTPSLLSLTQLESIFSALLNNGWSFSEVSLEANPGTVSKDKLRGFKEIGINRLSFGVQSFNNKLLRNIGRIHNREEAIQAILWAQEAGFKNINIDLMNSLPKQSIYDVYEDLLLAIELEPTHVSAYALKIEENTIFYKLAAGDDNFQPNDLIQERMYDLIPRVLENNGFKRYEISNFAKPNYECRHNKVYWHYRNYFAFGLGACSFYGHKRATNTFVLEEYLMLKTNLHNTIREVENITAADYQSEYIFMNLRLVEGLNCITYANKFSEDILVRYAEIIERHLKAGLLFFPEKNILALTERGFKYSNLVFRDFIN
ncbi:radical SAM family heme chaperone HemW [Succinispira mobilis]|uniref:radical SAM family heme chaperone HemW n=1 Tax=Succinispira mobilis TaxID=78120 RepID=UPI00048B027F|nr:radical SAM family heme chaperone HemW [Succinispira mobilis]